MSLGNKEIMAKNIQYYMDKYGISRNKLCDDLGFKYMTVSDWLKAKTYPRIDKIEMLAHYFNISKSDLVEDNNVLEFPTTSKDTDTLTQITSISATLVDFRQKKVLDYATAQKREQDSKIHEENVTYLSDYIEAKREGFVAAGTGQYVLDDHKEMVTIPSSILPKKTYDLMLQVKGDSMLPTFKDDEFVFVKKSTDIHNGQFGVFRINNESYIKKVYIENERLKLVSLNPSYPDLFFDETDDIELVGVVVM